MQRLFNTFANGWPGIGLFLQRLVTAAVLFHSATAHIGQVSPLALLALRIIAGGGGMLLLLGLWTPVAGTIVAIAELGIILWYPGDPWTRIMLAMLGATLAMLGPGAWSIDARLFGRKQIVIPER